MKKELIPYESLNLHRQKMMMIHLKNLWHLNRTLRLKWKGKKKWEIKRKKIGIYYYLPKTMRINRFFFSPLITTRGRWKKKKKGITCVSLYCLVKGTWNTFRRQNGKCYKKSSGLEKPKPSVLEHKIKSNWPKNHYFFAFSSSFWHLLYFQPIHAWHALKLNYSWSYSILL